MEALFSIATWPLRTSHGATDLRCRTGRCQYDDSTVVYFRGCQAILPSGGVMLIGDETMWPIRSALFVPAHRRDWVGKAIRVSPGAVVLDIEDSVPHEHKPQAMANLHGAIAELTASGVGSFVRVDVWGCILSAWRQEHPFKMANDG